MVNVSQGWLADLITVDDNRLRIGSYVLSTTSRVESTHASYTAYEHNEPRDNHRLAGFDFTLFDGVRLQSKRFF